MAIDTLSKLFGSSARVKLMRLFILNPDEGFENKDIARRAKVQPKTVRSEVQKLSSIGFIKKKTFYKEGAQKTKAGTPKKKKVQGWFLDPSFSYLKPLQALLIDTESYTQGRELKQRLRGAGKIKALIAGGIFMRDTEARIDLLVVGDQINKRSLEETIRSLEAEIGRELRYAVFDTPEFRYRLEMYDKLVCDVLDFPHTCLIDTQKLVAEYEQKRKEGK